MYSDYLEAYDVTLTGSASHSLEASVTSAPSGLL